MELIHQPPVGGRPLIQGYGDGGFRVSGRRYTGSILILPDATQSWPVGSMDELSLTSLTPIMEAEPPVELLVVGCGATFALAPVTLREVLKAKGIGIETMDTGAACRTYNVLAGEGRRVGAALVMI